MRTPYAAFAFALMLTAPALAQPVESVPLGPAPYTLQNETDDMATTPPPSDMATTSEALPPAPPPGADDLPPQSEESGMPAENSSQNNTTGIMTYENETAPYTYAPDKLPTGTLAGAAQPDKLPPKNLKFCTMKIAFGSRGQGTDQKTGDAVKSYLDANTDKLVYLRDTRGKEGEYSYCLEVEDHKNRAGVYKNLRRLLPDTADGPITLSGKGFETVTVR